MIWLRKLKMWFESPVQSLARLRRVDRKNTELAILMSEIDQIPVEMQLREFMTRTAMQVAILTQSIENSGVEIREKYRMSEWMDRIESFQKETIMRMDHMKGLMDKYESMRKNLDKNIEDLER